MWDGQNRTAFLPWNYTHLAGPAAALARRARGLRQAPPDLAIDLQGDVRAAGLMFLTGARRRVGYANTGGAYLLTSVVPLDETVGFVEQNRRAVAVAELAPLGCFPRSLVTPGARKLVARSSWLAPLQAKRSIARAPQGSVSRRRARAVITWRPWLGQDTRRPD
jgi:hypothetical protein